MNFFGKPEGRKIHTRDIKLSTYEYDNERLVIEGSRWIHPLLANL